MHIASLETNIKNAPRRLRLEPCTFVTGLNRTGKSSVLDALRLLFTGKHPVGGHPSDLMDLVPPGETSLYVHGVGVAPSDVVTWQMNIVEGLPKKPKPPAGRGAFKHHRLAESLVLDHGAGLSDGAERMRRRLVDRFGDLSDLPTPLGLDPEQLALWKEGASSCAHAKDVAAQLVEMTRWFKAQALERNKRADQCESVISKMTPNEDDILMESVRSAVAAQIEKAKAQERYDRDAPLRAAVQARVDDVNRQIEDIVSKRTEGLLSEVEWAEKKKAEVDRRLQHLRTLKTLVESARKAGGDQCPVCRGQNPDFDETLRILNQDIEDATRQFEERATTLLGLQKSLRHDEERQLRQELDKHTNQLRQLSAQNPEYTGQSSHELQQVLDRHAAASEAKQRVKKETEAMYRLRREAATCKLLNSQGAKEVGRVVKSIQDKAESAVNACLPVGGFRAHVHLSDKAAEWRMEGSDGRTHKRGARCGSEQGSLLYAFAEAFSPEDVPARIVLLDDVDLGVFDSTRLSDLCARFKLAVEAGRLDQVVIGWNRPNEAPADWHVINLPIQE